MAMMIERKVEGPATHALIIGVGAYSALPAERAGAGWHQAYHVATCLRDVFRNPSAPLGSIEFLASRRSGSSETADHGAVLAAAERWWERADAHPDNMTIFFFAGLGLAGSRDMLLALDEFDESSGNGLVSSGDLLKAMSSCRATRQAYFIDARRETLPSRLTHVLPEPLLEGRPDASWRVERAVYRWSGVVSEGFSNRYLTDALDLELRNAASDRTPLDTDQLKTRLEVRIKDFRRASGAPFDQGIAVESEGRFIFFDPGPALKTSAPAEEEVDGETIEQPIAEENPEAAGGPAGDDGATVPDESGGEPKPRAKAKRPSPTPTPASPAPTPPAPKPPTKAKRSSPAPTPPAPKPRTKAKRPSPTPTPPSPTPPSPGPVPLSPPTPEPPAAPATETESPVETYTEFVSDDAEVEQDALERGVLAISLARQLHRIWRKNSGLDVAEARAASQAGSPAGGGLDSVPERTDSGAFVLHLDAPWGGGKTTFAHFVSRVLNPYGGPSRQPPRFLTERYGKEFNLGKLFVEPEFGPESRRPWITVWFNAWQAEDCQPPWWIFYQAIRKGCFDAIQAEGDEPLDLAREGPPLPQPDWERGYKWRRLIRAEYWWRIRDPKIMTPFAAALVSIGLALILWSFGVIAAGAGGTSFALGNGFGFVLAAVTGIGALWSIGTFVTESVAPGTNSLAERLSLGSADPFQRFRDHFERTMESVRRPVMVVVDDLDRCKPEFIVNLMRGIQILLRSPRVVFVILGDRDWIERAFEKHHEALSKVSVGPEQSLGARFVEKTIQMSFILPGMKHMQEAYVRRILLGAAGEKAASEKRAAPEVAVQVREAVKAATSNPNQAVFDTEGLRERVREEFAQQEVPAEAAGAPEPTGEQLSRLIDEEVAIHVSADESAEREIVHLLQKLAPYFPSNPRQIKRIINAMTTYTSVALGVEEGTMTPDRLTRLAIWVILMTEWPQTWRLLASCPMLADAIADGDGAEARLKALAEADLPGSMAATLREVRRISGDPRLHVLITGKGREGVGLDGESVARLRELTPLYRGRRELAELESKEAPATAQRRPPKFWARSRRI